jgi:hypothetical protein
MTKKKTKEGSGKARIEGASAERPSRKSNKKPDDTVKEFMGVHVINLQDIENHFGTSETKESVQPAANRPKADVHLHLDAQVWQEAQTAAADAKMELSHYVEMALNRFKDVSVK